MTAVLDLPHIVRGDDYTHTFRFWTDQTKTSASDLTGRIYTAQMRSDPDDTNATSFDVDTADLATGIIVLTLAQTVTAELAGRSYVWDLQEDASGVRTTLLGGQVQVVKDVTR